MKTLILLLIITAAVSGIRASEEEGLFIVVAGVAPKKEFKDGEIIVRWKAERLKLTQAVFRHDTDDQKQYWLELDFTKWADPGDFYLFKVDGRDYQGFIVRGEGTNEKGGRWALRFTYAGAGRKLLAKIAAVYDLPPKHSRDKTKGDPAAAGQPVIRPIRNDPLYQNPQP